MKIIKTKDYEHMSRVTANLLSAQVIMKPDCVLGLATGSTPVGAYKQLVQWFQKGDFDARRTTHKKADLPCPEGSSLFASIPKLFIRH